MADLPQHARQVALLRDLLRGSSKWQPLVYIDWFTPYFAGFGPALLLSFVMPVLLTLKLLLADLVLFFAHGMVLWRELVLTLLCWLFLAVHVERLLAFARESAPSRRFWLLQRRPIATSSCAARCARPSFPPGSAGRCWS